MYTGTTGICNAGVNLIGNTTTERGLRIRAALDTRRYPSGIKVTDEEMSELKIKPASFHGDWNYVIVGRRNRQV